MNWITLIGMTAATLTTVAFLPQVIKVIKTKDTRGLSVEMYSVFVVGISLWLLYGILIQDVPVILANIVSLVLAGIILVYILKNK